MSSTRDESHATAEPAPELRPFIARYGGSRRAGFAPREHPATPSRFATLIVSVGAPVDVTAMPDASLQGPGRFQSFVAGLHAAPAWVRDTGEVDVVHAFLTPLGVRSLFGVSAAALASRVVDLGDLIGGRAAELLERLAGARSWPERFRLLDDVLARKLESAPVAPELAHAWRRLIGARGTLPIGALAREIGWSRRHFGERFRAELGLSPKSAARVIRFDHACSVLGRGDLAIGAVAASCGYADQSHLTREWVELSGCTPRAWLAEELPFLQDYELCELAPSES